jgi:hypothetical protein
VFLASLDACAIKVLVNRLPRMLHLPESISLILTFKDNAALRMKKIKTKKQSLQKQLQQMIQDPPSFRASPYRLTNKTMIKTVKPVDQKRIQRFV